MRIVIPPRLRGVVTQFDNRADDAFGRLRGHPTADRVFYGASALGDWGLIWIMLGALRGLRSEHDWHAAVRVGAGVGVESILVNVGIKSLFRRRRPLDETFIHPLRLRRPRTSSFPSGHATSAFTAATLLADGDPIGPVYYGAAAVVAASRVYVKIHHASDVIAGVAVGLVLGRLARHLFPLPVEAVPPS